jgi:hypothetical protein
MGPDRGLEEQRHGLLHCGDRVGDGVGGAVQRTAQQPVPELRRLRVAGQNSSTRAISFAVASNCDTNCRLPESAWFSRPVTVSALSHQRHTSSGVAASPRAREMNCIQATIDMAATLARRAASHHQISRGA